MKKVNIERKFFLKSTEVGIAHLSRQKLEKYALDLVHQVIVLQDMCRDALKKSKRISRLDIYIKLAYFSGWQIESYFQQFGLNIIGSGYMGEYFNVFGEILEQDIEKFMIFIEAIEDFSPLIVAILPLREPGERNKYESELYERFIDGDDSYFDCLAHYADCDDY